MVTIFTLTASLLYADQNLMAPNLSLIAEEFGFDEEQKTKWVHILSSLCLLFADLLSDTAVLQHWQTLLRTLVLAVVNDIISCMMMSALI